MNSISFTDPSLGYFEFDGVDATIVCEQGHHKEGADFEAVVRGLEQENPGCPLCVRLVAVAELEL